jgi:hypothetical protein
MAKDGKNFDGLFDMVSNIQKTIGAISERCPAHQKQLDEHQKQLDEHQCNLHGSEKEDKMGICEEIRGLMKIKKYAVGILTIIGGTWLAYIAVPLIKWIGSIINGSAK